jgi:hypothetical protein
VLCSALVIAAPAAPDAPLTAAEHAALELRRVGITLIAELQLLGARLDGNLGRLLGDCRTQLASLGARVPHADEGPLLPAADELQLVVAQLERRVAATARAGGTTPLAALVRTLALSPLELDALCLAALPEESSLWGSLFGALADNLALRRPTMHLFMNFVHGERPRHQAIRTLVEGPLFAHQLVRLEPADAPLADRALVVAPETWLALAGVDATEAVLAPHLVSERAPAVEHGSPILDPDTAGRLDALVASWRGGAPARAVLVGASGSGRRTVAHFAAAQLGRPLVTVQLPGADVPASFAAAAVRHALVRDAALLFRAAPSPGEPVRIDARVPPTLPCFLALGERSEARGATFAAAPRLELPAPTVREREQLWQRLLPRNPPGAASVLDPGELARRFRLSGGEIADVIDEMQRQPSFAARAPELADVAAAVRERPFVRLETMARRRRARAGWDDLVVAPALGEQLREISARLQHRDRVYDEWRLGGRGARQASVLSLFVGSSGTGKTLAAEVVAGDLGLDLFCIDMSQVVSKYIGETEKNLARVFDAAEGGQAVLFFDEADGLFGKRTEARDAHDRYANLEVSYLLARLETFSGLAILASNLRQNIDAAFLRRIDFIVEFQQPDTRAREQLWRSHLGRGLPLEGDIDAASLAESFPVSGAHIRNAVVGGAFRAASEGCAVGQRHLLQAMQREYDKLGKSFPLVAVG